MATATESLFWRASKLVPDARRYAAVLPPGLHLGCGLVTTMRTESRAGVVEGRGARAVALVCHEPLHVRTELAGGPYVSAGLSLPLCADECAELLQELRARDRELASSLPVPTAIVLRLAASIDPWFDGTARRLVAEARALELQAVLIAALRGTVDTQPPVRQSQRQRRLALGARDCLDSRLAEPPTLAVLAAQLGTNPRSVNIAFRAVFGTSIGVWVARRRLDAAAELLRTGEQVKAVASRLGYSQAHFSAAFRRRFGIRPSSIARGR